MQAMKQKIRILLGKKLPNTLNTAVTVKPLY